MSKMQNFNVELNLLYFELFAKASMEMKDQQNIYRPQTKFGLR